MDDTTDTGRPTPPHEALAAWREAQGLTLVEAGTRVGVKGPTWHEYETNGSIPKGGYRIAIEILTGIPADSWMPERERAAIAAARVAVADREALDAANVEPDDSTEGDDWGLR